MDMKSTSRCLNTDICLLLLMWEVPTEAFLIPVSVTPGLESREYGREDERHERIRK
jgi:hypothetical protein